MRRAVVQNLRTFRRPSPRKALKLRNSSNVLGQRAIASRSSPSTSSMRFRRISTAVGAAAVAGGAFYAYRTGYGNAPGVDSRLTSLSASPTQARAQSTSSQSLTNAAAGAASEEASEAVRRALVVEQGALYTTAIPENQPVSKETDSSGRKVLEMMTPDQVTHKLRTNEESYLVGRGRGVVRYDVVQIPSNDPIEDDHAEKIIDVPQTVAATQDGNASSDWMFWGVFDGHAGWTTSAKLRQALISFVARELNETYTAALTNPSLTFPTSDSVDSAIKKGFLRLDKEITHDSVQKVLKAKNKALASELLGPALSGSCALLSFYDSRSKELRVACTGDSRAVLGRRGPSGKWTATPLSVDQTGSTDSEVARLRAEHPNEPYVTANGRILGGLEPSRAFGDAVYKWSKETQDLLKQTYFTRTPSKYLKTPPYVTAEPVITTTKVQPEKGDFVVMATDGLWEMLTNEEVIGLVGQWLEVQAKNNSAQSTSATSSGSWLKSWFSSSPKQGNVLPVESADGPTEAGGHGQRAPIRQQQWGVTSPQSERFVVKDKNAATHLVRNALGGRDEEMVSALLTLPSPYSRRYRDDLTVEVIFFGEGNESGGAGPGKVELNREASASASVEGVKPKL
ncbi:[Pyruvate dehydrogenase [acetyl-transferring]]-phosphatase 1, mitochondrial [Zalaria obscura]|uniref:[Pyruvate dehydrogenase [acetyl-transferring]]-phosphatase 1, mitochondrial n=1 Tax=Zalaria obscura TaxID=2024903 RepID=A0ACC3SMD1_9PEZI